MVGVSITAGGRKWTIEYGHRVTAMDTRLRRSELDALATATDHRNGNG